MHAAAAVCTSQAHIESLSITVREAAVSCRTTYSGQQRPSASECWVKEANPQWRMDDGGAEKRATFRGKQPEAEPDGNTSTGDYQP